MIFSLPHAEKFSELVCELEARADVFFAFALKNIDQKFSFCSGQRPFSSHDLPRFCCGNRIITR
jgi:hypothetical protein